jgi:thiosulfate/3-mercaptopyruvate sulfurtransferase
MDGLVSTLWLNDHLNDPEIRIIDVRWYLFEEDKTGRSEYLRGHIPGSVFVDLEVELAAPAGEGLGRHPIPRPEVFASSMARAGVGPETHIIAYDDSGGATAARLWWLLRYYGHNQVSLLDGGITQWVAEERPLQIDVPIFRRTTFNPVAHPDMVVNKETIDRLRTDARARILDVRLAERYEGKVEPIDSRAGHVPGAINAPLAGNWASPTDRRFLSPADLRERFKRLGVNKAEQVVAYCGSGVNACQMLFALNLAGFSNALLYEGSWSDWSRDPSLPMATGPNPK